MRNKHDAGIKEMCSTGTDFGRCSNFTLEPEQEPTVIACLTGRDAQEVFILDLSKYRAAFQGDCDSCEKSGTVPIFTILSFPHKHIPS